MKVIDQDTFPSSFFAKELQEDLENAEAVNQMGLFIEYVKLAAQLGTMGNGWVGGKPLVIFQWRSKKNPITWPKFNG